jgi:hypothetical protein
MIDCFNADSAAKERFLERPNGMSNRFDGRTGSGL